MTTHSHPDGKSFRPAAEYETDRPCYQCCADAGVPCSRKRSTGMTGTHALRLGPAQAHERRDQGKAPWPENREPGVCYSTLTTCN